MTNAKSIAVAFQEAGWLIDRCLDLRHNDCGVLNSRFTASHSLARLLNEQFGASIRDALLGFNKEAVLYCQAFPTRMHTNTP
jgi:hypothetical protein